MAGSAAGGGGVIQPTDPGRDALLGVLIRHAVAFVLIGGAAIQSHGGTYDTQDIGLAPEADEANLHRLCDALNELRRRLTLIRRTPRRGLRWPTTTSRRAASGPRHLDLAIRYGQIDVTFAPSAFPTGYAELSKRADQRQVAGTRATVLVAALEDVHRSKHAADRPKDHAYFQSLAEPGDP